MEVRRNSDLDNLMPTKKDEVLETDVLPEQDSDAAIEVDEIDERKLWGGAQKTDESEIVREFPSGSDPEEDEEIPTENEGAEKADVYYEDLDAYIRIQGELAAEAELEKEEALKKKKAKARKSQERAIAEDRRRHEEEMAVENEQRRQNETEHFHKQESPIYDDNSQIYRASFEGASSGLTQDDSVSFSPADDVQQLPLNPVSEGEPGKHPEIPVYKTQDYVGRDFIAKDVPAFSYRNGTSFVGENSLGDSSGKDGKPQDSFSIPQKQEEGKYINDAVDRSQAYDQQKMGVETVHAPSYHETPDPMISSLPVEAEGDGYTDARSREEKKRKEYYDEEYQHRQTERQAKNEAVVRDLQQGGAEREKKSENYQSFGSAGIDYSGKNQHSALTSGDGNLGASVTIQDQDYKTLRLNFEETRRSFRSYGENVPEDVVKQYKEACNQYFSVQRRIDNGELTIVQTSVQPSKIVEPNSHYSVHSPAPTYGNLDLLSRGHENYREPRLKTSGSFPYDQPPVASVTAGSSGSEIGHQEFSYLKENYQRSRDAFLSCEGNVPKEVIAKYQEDSVKYLSVMDQINEGVLRVSQAPGPRSLGQAEGLGVQSVTENKREQEERSRYLFEKERQVSSPERKILDSAVNPSVISEKDFKSIRDNFKESREQFFALGAGASAALIAKHQQDTRLYISTLSQIQRGELQVVTDSVSHQDKATPYRYGKPFEREIFESKQHRNAELREKEQGKSGPSKPHGQMEYYEGRRISFSNDTGKTVSFSGYKDNDYSGSKHGRVSEKIGSSVKTDSAVRTEGSVESGNKETLLSSREHLQQKSSDHRVIPDSSKKMERELYESRRHKNADLSGKEQAENVRPGSYGQVAHAEGFKRSLHHDIRENSASAAYKDKNNREIKQGLLSERAKLSLKTTYADGSSVSGQDHRKEITQSRFDALRRRNIELQEKVSSYQGQSVPPDVSKRAERASALYTSIQRKISTGDLRLVEDETSSSRSNGMTIVQNRFENLQRRHTELQDKVAAYHGKPVPAVLQKQAVHAERRLRAVQERIARGDLSPVHSNHSYSGFKHATAIESVKPSLKTTSVDGRILPGQNHSGGITRTRLEKLRRRNVELQEKVSSYQGQNVPPEVSKRAEQVSALYTSIQKKISKGDLRFIDDDLNASHVVRKSITPDRYENIQRRHTELQDKVAAYHGKDVPPALQKQAVHAERRLRSVQGRIASGDLRFVSTDVKGEGSQTSGTGRGETEAFSGRIKMISQSRYAYLQRKYEKSKNEVASYKGKAAVPAAVANQAEKISRIYNSVQRKINSGIMIVVPDSDVSTNRRSERKGEGTSQKGSGSEGKTVKNHGAEGTQVFRYTSTDNFGKDAKRTGNMHIKPKGTPIQGSPLAKYDKLKIYHTTKFGTVFDRATRRTLGAVGSAIVYAARSEESGTANTILEAKQRVQEAVIVAKVLVGAPTQFAAFGAGVSDTVHGARNAGRFFLGKERLDPLQHKTRTLRQLEREMRNPFLAEEKEVLKKNFGSDVNAKFGKTSNGRLQKARSLHGQVEALEQKRVLLRAEGKDLSAEDKLKLKALRKQRKEAFHGIAPAEHRNKLLVQTAKSKNLKAEIKALQAKGAALTAAERKQLMDLLKQKKALDQEIRKLHTLIDIEGKAVVRNSKVDWVSSKDAKRTLKKTAKKKLKLSENDKGALARLKAKIAFNEKWEKFQKAKQARTQMRSVLGGFLLKAARESEETSVRGLIGASRLVQNRYARTVLKYSMKGAWFSVVLAGKGAALAATGTYTVGRWADSRFNGGRIGTKIDQGVNAVTSTSKAVVAGAHKVEEAAVRKVIHSRVYRELNGGLYQRAKTKISSMVPRGLKTKIDAGVKQVDLAKSKARKVLDQFNNWKKRLAESRVGRAVKSIGNGFQAFGKAFGFVKKWVVRTGLSAAAMLIVVYLIGAFFTSAGSVAGSFVMKDEMTEDKIELTDFVEILNDEQEVINARINNYKQMTEANGGKYRNVNVLYSGEGGNNNFKEIMSMTAVYFDQDFEKSFKVKNYLKQLYKASNFLSTSESEMYYCVGCEERTFHCYDALDEYATDERKTLKDNVQYSGSTKGCQKSYYYCTTRGHSTYSSNGCYQHGYDYWRYEQKWMTDPGDCDNYRIDWIDRNKPSLGFKYWCKGHCYGNHYEYSCPGHTETICKGHIDLNVIVTCFTFDEIFYCLDNPGTGTPTVLVGNSTTEKVWNFLKSKGIADIQAASIMGNIQWESGFDPSNIESGSGVGFGLCQWSKSRRTQLETYAAAMGKSPSDLALQLDFFWMEYHPSAQCGYTEYIWTKADYPFSSFVDADSIEEATEIFCFGWEKPKVETAHLDRRISAAKDFFNLYAGTEINGGTTEETTPDENDKTGSAAEDPKFEWNNENQDWAKSIFENMTKEYYEGLDKIIYGIGDAGGYYDINFDSSALVVDGDFVWPVTSTYISSAFGYRTNPRPAFHKGVDIPVGVGTPVCAAADGTVTVVSYQEGGAGYYVVIEHANGVVTKYMHHSQNLVQVGQSVSAGEVIALSGNTGYSTGPHLHFQFEVNGTAIDPCVQYSGIQFTGNWYR